MVTELNDISKNIYKLESKNPTVGVLVYIFFFLFIRVPPVTRQFALSAAGRVCCTRIWIGFIS
jgi:hypothetical protein